MIIINWFLIHSILIFSSFLEIKKINLKLNFLLSHIMESVTDFWLQKLDDCVISYNFQNLNSCVSNIKPGLVKIYVFSRFFE